MQELICNRTRELKEDGESKEWLTGLGVGEQYGGVVLRRSGELELAPLWRGAPLELFWLLTAKGLLKSKCPLSVPW